MGLKVPLYVGSSVPMAAVEIPNDCWGPGELFAVLVDLSDLNTFINPRTTMRTGRTIQAMSELHILSSNPRSFWRLNTVQLLILMLSLLLGGCVNVSIVNHDETKALERGRALLVALYVRKDFSQALEQFDPKAREAVSEASLSRLVSSVTREFGPVLSLEYDRWFPVLGRRSASVVFVAIHKGGRSYQRVELRGDASGYLAEAISYSNQPIKQ